MLQNLFFVLLLSSCSLYIANGAPSLKITSVTLTFNPMVGVLDDDITVECLAMVTVNVSMCTLRFDYGFATNEVAGGAGLKLYNHLILSPVNVSSAGQYTCTVSVIDTDACRRNISAKTSAAVTLTVQFPSGLITSASLSLSKTNVTVGSSVSLTCTAVLSVDVPGAMIVFDYGFMTNTMDAVAGNTQTQMATVSPVELSSAGEYTCTVTVAASGVCGGGESEPACPTKTSDPVTLRVEPISMQVEVISNMDMVLNVAPYNNHTLNCTVIHESFAHINGELVYSFIKEGVMLHEQNKSISHPGPFTALYTASEWLEGMSQHICNVALKINETLITSAMNGTIVEVVGPMPPTIPTPPNVTTSTTNATVSWTVPEVTYTPENYTVYYDSVRSCSLSGGDVKKYSSSITTYTPNNQTLADFFFEKDLNFSIQIVGLTPSTHYCCFVMATNNHGSTKSEHVSFETETDTTDMTATYDDSAELTQWDMLVIVAVIGIALVLMTACFLILVCYCVCYKKRSGKFKVSAQRERMDCKVSVESAERLELKSVENTDSLSQVFHCKNGEAISMDDFPHYVKKKGKEALEEEYEELQSFDYKCHEAALKNENRPKNRFQNIHPFDDSRVTLKLLPEDDSSDYINASFIGNHSEHCAYIAAQGPLSHTVDDFWRMVWEYELPTIIMLTQLEESGKEKCSCYWPEDGNDTKYLDNDLDLKLLTQTVSPLFVTRKFRLTKIGDDSRSPLTVTQYHFAAWPDHGVPDDKTCITAFISFVRKKHPPSGPPLLVHCSAGVGRTGTFIVLDVMLQRMKEKGTIDIQGYVNQIRTNRMMMVQTALQYVYIHEVLSEYLVCGDTSFAVMNARIHMRKLGTTGFQKQLQLLEELDLAPFNPSMSDGEEYPEKNRYTYNLPYNLNRVRLRVMDDNYINASWVNGYKHRRMFLATQVPLEETVEDFWRMVWENNSRAIVMLSLIDQGEENCSKKKASYQYWPTEVNDKMTFRRYEVTLTSEQPGHDYNTRKLSLKKMGNNKTTTVTQYHYLHWPEGGKPKGTASIIRLCADLVKTQSSTGNKAITVMCNDGMGRTGAFICIYSQLERIKTEATADIFQCVKSSRLQRAGLVRTLDEYVFCYEVVADYNDDMSHYGNFKYEP